MIWGPTLTFFSAVGEFFQAYTRFIEAYPERRIVSFYPASEKTQNEVQLNLADGSCLTIYSNGTWSEFSEEIIPGVDLMELGEPEPWPFEFLANEEE